MSEIINKEDAWRNHTKLEVETYIKNELDKSVFIGSDGVNSATQKGTNSIAFGDYSSVEGYNSRTGGSDTYNTLTPGSEISNGAYAHAEGNATIARGNSSHSEGKKTFADVDAAHAEGYNTLARAVAAHAEGQSTMATNTNSHAEGYHTTASGKYSHSEGKYTTSQNESEHSEGQYNVSNKASTTFGDGGNTISSIGIGSSVLSKNAFEVMQNGDIYILGIGGYDGTNAGQSGVKTLQQVLLNQ